MSDVDFGFCTLSRWVPVACSLWGWHHGFQIACCGFRSQRGRRSPSADLEDRSVLRIDTPRLRRVYIRRWLTSVPPRSLLVQIWRVDRCGRCVWKTLDLVRWRRRCGFMHLKFWRLRETEDKHLHLFSKSSKKKKNRGSERWCRNSELEPFLPLLPVSWSMKLYILFCCSCDFFPWSQARRATFSPFPRSVNHSVNHWCMVI